MYSNPVILEYSGFLHTESVKKPLMFEQKLALECSGAKSGRQTRSVTGTTDLGKCVVCQDYKLDAQNRRLAEKLTQCATYEAEFRLLVHVATLDY